MPSKINRELERYNVNIGPIRMETDELIDFLKDDTFFSRIKTISITSGDFEFTDIEDLSNNKALLSKYAEIKCKFDSEEYSRFTISVAKNGTSVSSYSMSETWQLNNLSKISNHLKGFKTPLSFLARIDGFYIFTFAFSFFFISQMIFYSFGLDISFSSLVKASVSFAILFLVFWFPIKYRGQLYYQVKPSFLDRIGDQLLLYIMTFIIGGVMTYFATKFGLINP